LRASFALDSRPAEPEEPGDAIGGTSVEAHRAGLERVVQVGGKPISWVSLAAELQRDWAREETAADIVEMVLTERLLKA
jgi:hypothetical protein